MNKNYRKKLYSDYVRKELLNSELTEWNKISTKKFDFNISCFKEYFLYLSCSENSNYKKDIINEFFDLNGLNRHEKFILLPDRVRTFVNFFSGKSGSSISSIEFLIKIFEADLLSFEEFIEKNYTWQVNKKTKTKKMLYKIFVPITIFTTLLLLFFVNNSNSFNISDKFRNESEIENTKSDISVAESAMPVKIGNTAFTSNDSETNIEKYSFENTYEDTVIWHTKYIFNSKSVYRDAGWDFKVDSEGEDMSSEKYGGMFFESIDFKETMSIGTIPIARDSMIIKFSFENKTDKKLRIQNLMFEIVDSYNISGNENHYNCYKSRVVTTMKFIMSLKSGKNFYQFETEERIIQPGFDLPCEITVTGNKDEFKGKAVVFIGKAECKDASNNSYKVISDKKYIIAFL